MSISASLKESRIAKFWLKYNDKIVLGVGIILVAAISYEAGFLEGSKNKQDPIVVNKVATADFASANSCQNQTNPSNISNSSANSNLSSAENSASVNTDNQKCAYVASKNSNKYHLPTCQFAQKIKPENKICFSSKEEAEKRGYQGAKCCIK